MAILDFLTIPGLGPKHTEPCAASVPKAKLGLTEPCATSVPKVKLGHIEPRALSGYLTPSNCYIGFPYCPLVRPKTHGTACDIGPKGEARTHELRAPLVPKVKLRYPHMILPCHLVSGANYKNLSENLCRS